MSAEAKKTQEKRPEFNPESFRGGDFVSYYQDGQWRKGILDTRPEVRGGRIFITANGIHGEVELGVPPKKIELPSKNQVNLSGKDYEFNRDSVYLDENGNPLLDLTQIDTGRRVIGVEAVLLRECESAVDTARKSDVKDDVEKVVGMRRRELLARQLDLDKKIQKMKAEFGSPSEWTDFEAEEIEDLRTAVRKMRDEIEKTALDLRREVDTVVGGQEKTERARQAEVHMERLKRLEDIALAGPRKKYEEEQEEREEWLKKKAEDDNWLKRDREFREYPDKKRAYDDAMAQGGGGKGKKAPPDPGPTRPPDPGIRVGPPQGMEPPKPKEIKEQPYKDGADFGFYKGLDDKDEVKIEVEKRRKEKAQRLELGDDYPSGKPAGTDEEKRQVAEYRQVTVEILREVLSEWKGKTAEKQPEFDFDKEKKEMEDKVRDLRRRNEAFNDTDVEDRLKRVDTFIWTVDRKGSGVVDWSLAAWKSLNKAGLLLFEKEQARISKGGDVKEREIDVPQQLWERILAGRRDAVNEVLNTAYTAAQTGGVDKAVIRRGLERLFAKAPDEDTLRQLRACGIRSWEGFQTRLKGGLGERLAAALGEMARDHLRREVAKNTSSLDKFRAMKAQVIARSVINVGFVGVTATSLMALVGGPEAARFFGSTVTAQRIMGGIGGAIGGAVSSVLDKLIWGREGAKQKTAERMAKLEEKKRKELAPGLATEQQDYFSAILSQATREASAKPLAETEPEEAKQLDVNARRLYVDSLRRAEMTGQDVTAEQRRELALVLLEMQAGTRERAEEALSTSKPSVALLLTGDKGVYSGEQTEVGKAVFRSAVTGAIMGLAMSGRWESLEEPLFGAALGATAGGLHGENERKRAEMKKGAEVAEDDYRKVTDFFSREARLESERPRLAGLEQDFESKRSEWIDLSDRLGYARDLLRRLESDYEYESERLRVLESKLDDLNEDDSDFEQKRNKIESDIRDKRRVLVDMREQEIANAGSDVRVIEEDIRPLEDLREKIQGIRDMEAQIDGDREEVTGLVLKFKAALRGGQMKEVEGEGGVKVEKPVEEQWYVEALDRKNNPMLRARVESLVYDAEKVGMLVEEEAREDLGLVLQRLAERSKEIEEQVKKLPVGGGRLRTAGYAGAGAAAGLVAAYAASGISEASRHVLQDWLGIGLPPKEIPNPLFKK